MMWVKTMLSRPSINHTRHNYASGHYRSNLDTALSDYFLFANGYPSALSSLGYKYMEAM